MLSCPTRQIASEMLRSQNGISYRKGIYERTNPESEETTTTEQIVRHAPYDETDYHWAKRFFPGCMGNPWKVYRSGKHVETLDAQLSYEEVIKKLVVLDTLSATNRQSY